MYCCMISRLRRAGLADGVAGLDDGEITFHFHFIVVGADSVHYGRVLRHISQPVWLLQGMAQFWFLRREPFPIS